MKYLMCGCRCGDAQKKAKLTFDFPGILGFLQQIFKILAFLVITFKKYYKLCMNCSNSSPDCKPNFVRIR